MQTYYKVTSTSHSDQYLILKYHSTRKNVMTTHGAEFNYSVISTSKISAWNIGDLFPIYESDKTNTWISELTEEEAMLEIL